VGGGCGGGKKRVWGVFWVMGLLGGGGGSGGKPAKKAPPGVVWLTPQQPEKKTPNKGWGKGGVWVLWVWGVVTKKNKKNLGPKPPPPPKNQKTKPGKKPPPPGLNKKKNRESVFKEGQPHPAHQHKQEGPFVVGGVGGNPLEKQKEKKKPKKKKQWWGKGGGWFYFYCDGCLFYFWFGVFVLWVLSMCFILY